MKMGKGQICPPGTELKTKEQCKDALKWVKALKITQGKRQDLVQGSWDHLPYQCSYQAIGDKAFHFNTKQTKNPPNFVNGHYEMICKKRPLAIKKDKEEIKIDQGKFSGSCFQT